jgi:transcription antitermination factor NusG
MEWYVLRTEPKREAYAAKGLERQGFRVYLPLIKAYKRDSTGRRIAQNVPVFRLYLFIRMEWQKRRSVLGTRGVKGFVGWYESTVKAPHIRNQDMRDLQARLTELAQTPVDQAPKAIEPGQLIQILLGPYKDRLAQVQDVTANRLSVLLEFAGVPLPVKLPKENVRLAL